MQKAVKPGCEYDRQRLLLKLSGEHRCALKKPSPSGAGVVRGMEDPGLWSGDLLHYAHRSRCQQNAWQNLPMKADAICLRQSTVRRVTAGQPGVLTVAH